MRSWLADVYRSTFEYTARALGIDPGPMEWLDALVDDVLPDIEMWLSAVAVMPEMSQRIGAES